MSWETIVTRYAASIWAREDGGSPSIATWRGHIGRMIVAAGAITLCLPCATPAIAARPTIRISTGLIAGVDRDGVTTYKGIPYAQPPVGALRWRAPQPPKPWKGVRDASGFGAICMQSASPDTAKAPAMSEDCLTINVWRPERAKGDHLPVLFWIHGGGWVSGSSTQPEYDGNALARRGIIVVSFNYRLGRFGFFAHPALTRADADHGWLGNYGYMDQLAALRWVHRNIAAFGGDPARVTIFGSSAGGSAVEEMMAAPQEARGLFSTAMAASAPEMDMPGLRTPSPKGLPSAEAAGVAFAKLVGAGDTPAALRAIPAQKVLEFAVFPNTRPDLFSGPMIDGRYVTETPMQAFAAGHVARVPYIGGAQNGEVLGAMLAPNADALATMLASQVVGTRQKQLWPLYDPDRSRNHAQVLLDMVGDVLFVAPMRETVLAMHKLGEPAWEYRFAYVPEAKRSTWLGAGHGSEGAYVFDQLDALDASVGPFSTADHRVAQVYSSYLVNFVKRHDPNGDGLPAWPTQQPTDRILWVGNNGIAAQSDPWITRLAAVSNQTSPPQ